jgi:hypothetical protein
MDPFGLARIDQVIDSTAGCDLLCFCWHKIRTLRQAHSKPNKAGLTRGQNPERASQFSWKLTKDKAVK